MSIPQLPPQPKAVNGIKEIELYGGAFTMKVPERFVDISYYRHLPNHQEVYIDPNGDQSIITELNSYQEVKNEEAVTVHWNDLMKDSKSSSIEITRQGHLGKEDLPNLSKYVDYVGFIEGTTKVGKYAEENVNTISTYILNMRLKCVTTDFLIIFNIPVEIATESAAAAVVTEGGEAGVEKQNEMNDAEKPQQNILSVEEKDKLIQDVIKSFKVVSMAIFPEMQ